jgi:hypothetical protein
MDLICAAKHEYGVGRTPAYDPPGMWKTAAVGMFSVLLLIGCGDGDGRAVRPTAVATETPTGTVGNASEPPPAPDGGMRAGHGAHPTRVVVPRHDKTPPAGIVSLQLPDGRTVAEAAQPGDAPTEVVKLKQPRLRGTAVGIDMDSGIVRVRVSVRELITCRAPSGATEQREKVSYFPPPQIERMNASPGARIPVRKTRSRSLELGQGRCPASMTPAAVDGKLWGEVINSLGLEAVTPHIRFRWSATDN